MKFEDMINTIQLGSCYDLIKDIPDKSIDLIYVDIPYLIGNGGNGGTSDTPLSHRILKEQYILGNKKSMKTMENKIKEYEEKMINATTQSEYEKWRVNKNNIVNMMNLKTADIVNGIDYSILDEFVRISKYIYIYMV